MNFDEFQHLARLYVIGALDEEEMSSFEHGRKAFGPRADRFLTECRRLSSIFALSLHPQPPARDAKKKLMSLIRAAGRRPGTPAVEAREHKRV